MSLAFMCDRCNKCFNPKLFSENDRYVYISEYFVMKDESRKYVYHQQEVHLCPKCARTFCDFMDGKEFVDKKLFDDLQKDVDYENQNVNSGVDHSKHSDNFIESFRNDLRKWADDLTSNCNGKSPEWKSKPEKKINN